MIQVRITFIPKLLIATCFLIVFTGLRGQTHISADPYNLLLTEKDQFEGRLPIQSNLFRPVFYDTDTSSFSFTLRSEVYYNDNAPNQENMDVRYFSKGVSNFNSIQLSFNSPFLSLMVEPYLMQNKFYDVNSVSRDGVYSVLNDRPLIGPNKYANQGFRNLLAFINYKGLGFGLHQGNRWWGPGIHSSIQMSTNTRPFLSNIIGTLKEIRIGPLGFLGIYSFSKINDEIGEFAKYFTSINAQLTYYGPMILSLGISRNYLTGGISIGEYKWTAEDAKRVVFEGFFISNLIDKEYTIGGHDPWDQTLSTYLTIILPHSGHKIYAEVAWNDNRMFFADFLSQPDHSMATVLGFRDIGVGNLKELVYGFEWTNLMITYTSRFRTGGIGTWYEREMYDYSSYDGRRWGAHSGADSDDWYFYVGYLSEKLMFIPSFNFERHGIVTHRPAEVKMEFRLDTRYNYKNIWFGIYFEKQFEAFLGFPDYFYVNDEGEAIDASEGKLANSRKTNTLIFSLTKTINF